MVGKGHPLAQEPEPLLSAFLASLLTPISFFHIQTLDVRTKILVKYYQVVSGICERRDRQSSHSKKTLKRAFSKKNNQEA